MRSFLLMPLPCETACDSRERNATPNPSQQRSRISWRACCRSSCRYRWVLEECKHGRGQGQGAEQSRAEQSRAEQSRAEQSRAEQTSPERSERNGHYCATSNAVQLQGLVALSLRWSLPSSRSLDHNLPAASHLPPPPPPCLQPSDPVAYLQEAIHKKIRVRDGLTRADTVKPVDLRATAMAARLNVLNRASSNLTSMMARRDELGSQEIDHESDLLAEREALSAILR